MRAPWLLIITPTEPNTHGVNNRNMAGSANWIQCFETKEEAATMAESIDAARSYRDRTLYPAIVSIVDLRKWTA